MHPYSFRLCLYTDIMCASFSLFFVFFFFNIYMRFFFCFHSHSLFHSENFSANNFLLVEIAPTEQKKKKTRSAKWTKIKMRKGVPRKLLPYSSILVILSAMFFTQSYHTLTCTLCLVCAPATFSHSLHSLIVSIKKKKSVRISVV